MPGLYWLIFSWISSIRRHFCQYLVSVPSIWQREFLKILLILCIVAKSRLNSYTVFLCNWWHMNCRLVATINLLTHNRRIWAFQFNNYIFYWYRNEHHKIINFEFVLRDQDQCCFSLWIELITFCQNTYNLICLYLPWLKHHWCFNSHCIHVSFLIMKQLPVLQAMHLIALAFDEDRNKVHWLCHKNCFSLYIFYTIWKHFELILRPYEGPSYRTVQFSFSNWDGDPMQ